LTRWSAKTPRTSSIWSRSTRNCCINNSSSSSTRGSTRATTTWCRMGKRAQHEISILTPKLNSWHLRSLPTKKAFWEKHKAEICNPNRNQKKDTIAPMVHLPTSQVDCWQLKKLQRIRESGRSWSAKCSKLMSYLTRVLHPRRKGDTSTCPRTSLIPIVFKAGWSMYSVGRAASVDLGLVSWTTTMTWIHHSKTDSKCLGTWKESQSPGSATSAVCHLHETRLTPRMSTSRCSDSTLKRSSACSSNMRQIRQTNKRQLKLKRQKWALESPRLITYALTGRQVSLAIRERLKFLSLEKKNPRQRTLR